MNINIIYINIIINIYIKLYINRFHIFLAIIITKLLLIKYSNDRSPS